MPHSKRFPAARLRGEEHRRCRMATRDLLLERIFRSDACGCVVLGAGREDGGY
jgi:hypothetical protein